MNIKKTLEYLETRLDDICAAEDFFELVKVLMFEDEELTKEYNRRLLSATEIQLRKTNNMDRYYELRKKSLLVDAKYSVDSYLQYIEWDREPEKRFYLPRRKTLKAVVDELQRLEDDELDLLTVSLPPGVGKTTLGIFYLARVMGRFPDSPNLASAHSDKLTRSFYDGALSIITDPEYLWADVFPGTRIAGTSSKDETIDLGKTKRFKTLTCRSIDGSLTGATRCEKILYVDDLVSGIEEALSRSRMDSLWVKYTNDLKSRKKKDCKEIHIATRWSIHDPIGRLERQYKDDPRAKFLSIPALNHAEESNFDYLNGVGYDTKYFIDMKETLDDVSWRCLYQNEPIEREGILYHENELRRYFELPESQYEGGKRISFKEPDAIIGICDTKETGSDYVFLPVGYIYGEDYYIDDCICDNGLPDITDPRIVEILMRNKVKMCRFESNSAGGRVADKVQGEIRKRGGITHITKQYTTANKETKIIVNSSWVKAHCVFLDSSKYRKESDYGKMMDFLLGWTMKGKNAHDDVPDGMAMFAVFAQSLDSGKTEMFSRPF